MKAPTAAATLPCSPSPGPCDVTTTSTQGEKEQPVAYNKGSFSLQGSPDSDYFGRAAHTKGLRHIPEFPPALSTEKRVLVKTSSNSKAFCLAETARCFQEMLSVRTGVGEHPLPRHHAQ